MSKHKPMTPAAAEEAGVFLNLLCAPVLHTSAIMKADAEKRAYSLLPTADRNYATSHNLDSIQRPAPAFELPFPAQRYADALAAGFAAGQRTSKVGATFRGALPEFETWIEDRPTSDGLRTAFVAGFMDSIPNGSLLLDRETNIVKPEAQVRHTSHRSSIVNTTSPTNIDRAADAQAALDAFDRTNMPGYASEPAEDRIADLMCNLLHLHAQQAEVGRSLTPYQLVRRAVHNFEAEREGR